MHIGLKIIIVSILLRVSDASLKQQLLDKSLGFIQPYERSILTDMLIHQYSRVRSIESKQCVWPPNYEPNSQRRYLILYSYYETNEALYNLLFFIRVALPQLVNNQYIDIVFTLNSELSINIPTASNIFVHRRNNYGYDICSHRQTLDSLIDIVSISKEDYKYIVLMNASVRGPFLVQGMDKITNWLAHFASLLVDNTHLGGLSINCHWHKQNDDYGLSHMRLTQDNRYPHLHLQSMFLITDNIGLPIIYNQLVCTHDRQTVLIQGEIGISRAILSAGYNIAAQLTYMKDANWLYPNKYCDIHKNFNHYHTEGDMWYNGMYLGMNIHPLDTIFYKTNRDIDDYVVQKYTDWSLASL